MITGLNHISLAVQNLDVSFIFYKDVLGFTPLCRWPKGAYFLVGELWFCLFEDSESVLGKGYTHIAFSVASENFLHMTERLNEANVPQWKENISEGDSLYFLDPDGYQLELHVGDWQSRLAYKKQRPWEGVEFFEL